MTNNAVISKHPTPTALTHDELVARLRKERDRRGRLSGPLGVLSAASVFIVAVLIWQLLVSVVGVPQYVLPSPISVFNTLIASLPNLFVQMVPTIQEIGAGFIAAALVAIPIGIAIAESPWAERILNPVLVTLQVVPMVAIAPLLVTWWGLGLFPKVAMVVLIAFFPIVVNTVAGMKAIAPEVIDLGRSMGASRLAMLQRVKLPGAMPSIFAGLRVGITLAVVGAVVAEFVGSDEGLGHLIVVANGRLNTPMVFATIIVLSVIGLLAYKAVEGVERIAAPWHTEKRRQHTG